MNNLPSLKAKKFLHCTEKGSPLFPHMFLKSFLKFNRSEAENQKRKEDLLKGEQDGLEVLISPSDSKRIKTFKKLPHIKKHRTKWD